uniref:Uncharacterized protein n=1 Tax=Anthurium amnicola TaxID=1678845 RepID=A0A1D1XC07_9ARAE
MTETSTTNVYCQANQECYYSVVGQVCSDSRCKFLCKVDSDCIYNGTCPSNNCDWSGQPVPPLIPPNFTQKNLDATSPNETTDNKLGSPFVIAIIVIVVLVVVLCLVITLFFVLRRRKLAESSRGLKPLHLTGSRSSLSRKGKRDSKEKERSSKKYQHDDNLIGSDDEGKEDFEDSYSPAAVGIQGTHRLPQRSQTMYGTSTPSTVELSVDYPVPQHHFMEQQQQIPYMESEEQQQQHHYTGEDQQQQQ